ncbi:MAG: excinuclease ABC subunit UvrC [Lachnospiraceae bacterium]|nr:excinuclease ABC subunit UvrC [Lachnospiraceae bacterium]
MTTEIRQAETEKEKKEVKDRILPGGFNVTEELKKLPGEPGVYIMRDADDTIIYVGKAVNLNNRVRSYFRSNIGRGPKIDRMVSLIRRFEYIVTDSELEALVLENNLIKEHEPRYNTMLRDDKTYPYIRVSTGEDYPRITFSRKTEKDGARYFGPYTSADAVRESIDLINRLYGLRDCSRKLPRDIGKERPCLNYHIGKCCGPCIEGRESAEQYKVRIEKALDFLNGNYAPVIKNLQEKMQAAAENLEFEEAASLRDLLGSVQKIAQKQKIEYTDREDKDIIALARDEEDAVVQIFFIRGGRMTGREHYYMKHTEEESEEHILTSFIEQFYSGTPFIPREIFIPLESSDGATIEKWLTEKRGSRVYLRTPKIGQKEKLVELAANNARLVLTKDREKIKRDEGRTIGAVKELEALLGMEGLERMESYDISNISGYENVASMVVYENGKPKKSDYRKFKIKTVVGPNDYASMKEVLTRRFEHGLKEREEGRDDGHFDRFPDIILMDGGRGQVNIALGVLDSLELKIPVCGMVKDDHHRTRGLFFNNVEIPIDKDSEAFKLLTRIQDEVHRFAIEYHRSLRTKEQVHSVLDDIPGVGPKRRRDLMRGFASLNDIREADVETLMEKGKLPKRVAEDIYAWFRREKEN